MSEKNNNRCNVCGSEIDYNKGDIALAFMSARQGHVNMINVALCNRCYAEKQIGQKIVELAEAANFKVVL